MVTHASALGRNGIHDWLLLRGTAIIIILYILYIFGFVLTVNSLTYDIWQAFFASYTTKIFTVLALLSILVHTWIGMWQVLTDYVKALAVRLLLQFVIVVILVVYLVYGTFVVWGV